MTKLLRNRRLNFHAAGGAGEAVSLLSFSKITNVRGQTTSTSCTMGVTAASKLSNLYEGPIVLFKIKLKEYSRLSKWYEKLY